MIISNNNTRESGRLKLTFDAVVKNNMIGLNLSKYLTFNRARWRKMIHVADPN